jgi:hypothetical protein
MINEAKILGGSAQAHVTGILLPLFFRPGVPHQEKELCILFQEYRITTHLAG